MNPHTKVVQRWNKFFVSSCLVAIFVDPLFFFLLYVLKVWILFLKYKVRLISKLLIFMGFACALDEALITSQNFQHVANSYYWVVYIFQFFGIFLKYY